MREIAAIQKYDKKTGLSGFTAKPEPLLSPTLVWMGSHVYACGCRFREKDWLWYLYFNARDGWRIKDGVERIGRISGKLD
ncbi:MAG: hypothetical protein WA234_09850 [Rectinemataceae bacterium]